MLPKYKESQSQDTNLSVDSHHPQYDSAAEKWQTCADAVCGQWAVHAAGVRYLPRLTEQSDDEYKAYKTRATYFNATGRTLDGLVGMVFRKPPVIEAKGIDKIIADVDLQDTSVNGLAEKILRQVIQSRIGVLVEYPQVIQVGMTAAQAEAINLRPYTSLYEAKTIINWRVDKINNVMQPTLVVLTETYNASNDEYEQELKPQLRVLKLGEFGYYQQIYRQDNGKKWVQFENDIVPLMSNNPLPFIPFYMFGAEDTSFDIHEPVLLDLADLNLAHYRVTADWEHACHFTGLPMLFFAGLQLNENEKIHLGSQTAVVSSNENSHGEYIEFTGQGLGALEKNLDRKEKQMAAIGARMLEQQKSGVEAEGTIAQRSIGETSVLASIANIISAQMSKMLSFMSEWAGNAQEVVYKLNTDYMAKGLTSAELAELVKAYQSSAISFETLFENLQRGEIVGADKTVEDEKDLIANSSAGLGLIGENSAVA